MTLFQVGDFTLASGAKTRVKVECDALTDEDWEGLAAWAVEILEPFGGVAGVPRGGFPFADALAHRAAAGCRTLLVVEDVVTTGRSIEQYLEAHPIDRRIWDKVIGVTAFARGKCPDWVTPVCRLPGA